MTARQPLAPVSGLKRTSSLPPPPPRTTDQISHTTTATTPPRATARTTPEPNAVASQQGSRTNPPSAHADTVRAISLSLPLILVDALKNRARAERVTHADVLMDAVTSRHEDLGALVEDAKPQTQSDALFTRRQRHCNPPTYVALSLRMLSSNVTALDDLTQRHNADSRSQLCAAALTGYLTP